MHCRTPEELAAYEARERHEAAKRMNAMFPPSRIVDLEAQYEHMPADWGTRRPEPRHFVDTPDLGSRPDALASYPDTWGDA
jgi:hypothetical protein